MSTDLAMTPGEYAQCPNAPRQHCAIPLAARQSILGEGMRIRRLLPHTDKRMIGAWCFFDHAGPVDVSDGPGVRVGPHPHTGLQTFSWMVDGEILHRDSLGYKQLLTQGQVNLMTAGKGISHSEESPEISARSATLQLAQFWIALPDDKRFIEPAFEHYATLPKWEQDGATITLLVGDWLGQQSPVAVHTPLLGADLTSQGATTLTLPLEPGFEYGIAVLTGSAQVDEHALEPGTLLYLGKDRSGFTLEIKEASQIILIGGEPFGEDILLYWNFVARNADEVRGFIEQWEQGDQFGTVVGFEGASLKAPPLADNVRLKQK
ncbi:pirin family protein [Isoalcanivorax beigongshangi]|uniref:Pirin family protein n=1 Tax=Isoalcanivorax beigongshangi TaxID=3238810 RepID=A0ABV4AIN3_9GAMM